MDRYPPGFRPLDGGRDQPDPFFSDGPFPLSAPPGFPFPAPLLGITPFQNQVWRAPFNAVPFHGGQPAWFVPEPQGFMGFRGPPNACPPHGNRIEVNFRPPAPFHHGAPFRGPVGSAPFSRPAWVDEILATDLADPRASPQGNHRSNGQRSDQSPRKREHETNDWGPAAKRLKSETDGVNKHSAGGGGKGGGLYRQDERDKEAESNVAVRSKVAESKAAGEVARALEGRRRETSPVLDTRSHAGQKQSHREEAGVKQRRESSNAPREHAERGLELRQPRGDRREAGERSHEAARYESGRHESARPHGSSAGSRDLKAATQERKSDAALRDGKSMGARDQRGEHSTRDAKESGPDGALKSKGARSPPETKGGRVFQLSTPLRRHKGDPSATSPLATAIKQRVELWQSAKPGAVESDQGGVNAHQAGAIHTDQGKGFHTPRAADVSVKEGGVEKAGKGRGEGTAQMSRFGSPLDRGQRKKDEARKGRSRNEARGPVHTSSPRISSPAQLAQWLAQVKEQYSRTPSPFRTPANKGPSERDRPPAQCERPSADPVAQFIADVKAGVPRKSDTQPANPSPQVKPPRLQIEPVNRLAQIKDRLSSPTQKHDQPSPQTRWKEEAETPRSIARRLTQIKERLSSPLVTHDQPTPKGRRSEEAETPRSTARLAQIKERLSHPPSKPDEASPQVKGSEESETPWSNARLEQIKERLSNLPSKHDEVSPQVKWSEEPETPRSTARLEQIKELSIPPLKHEENSSEPVGDAEPQTPASIARLAQIKERLSFPTPKVYHRDDSRLEKAPAHSPFAGLQEPGKHPPETEPSPKTPGSATPSTGRAVSPAPQGATNGGTAGGANEDVQLLPPGGTNWTQSEAQAWKIPEKLQKLLDEGLLNDAQPDPGPPSAQALGALNLMHTAARLSKKQLQRVKGQEQETRELTILERAVGSHNLPVIMQAYWEARSQADKSAGTAPITGEPHFSVHEQIKILRQVARRSRRKLGKMRKKGTAGPQQLLAQSTGCLAAQLDGEPAPLMAGVKLTAKGAGTEALTLGGGSQPGQAESARETGGPESVTGVLELRLQGLGKGILGEHSKGSVIPSEVAPGVVVSSTELTEGRGGGIGRNDLGAVPAATVLLQQTGGNGQGGQGNARLVQDLGESTIAPPPAVAKGPVCLPQQQEGRLRPLSGISAGASGKQPHVVHREGLLGALEGPDAAKERLRLQTPKPLAGSEAAPSGAALKQTLDGKASVKLTPLVVGPTGEKLGLPAGAPLGPRPLTSVPRGAPRPLMSAPLNGSKTVMSGTPKPAKSVKAVAVRTSTVATAGGGGVNKPIPVATDWFLAELRAKALASQRKKVGEAEEVPEAPAGKQFGQAKEPVRLATGLAERVVGKLVPAGEKQELGSGKRKPSMVVVRRPEIVGGIATGTEVLIKSAGGSSQALRGLESVMQASKPGKQAYEVQQQALRKIGGVSGTPKTASESEGRVATVQETGTGTEIRSSGETSLLGVVKTPSEVPKQAFGSADVPSGSATVASSSASVGSEEPKTAMQSPSKPSDVAAKVPGSKMDVTKGTGQVLEAMGDAKPVTCKGGAVTGKGGAVTGNGAIAPAARQAYIKRRKNVLVRRVTPKRGTAVEEPKPLTRGPFANHAGQGGHLPGVAAAAGSPGNMVKKQAVGRGLGARKPGPVGTVQQRKKALLWQRAPAVSGETPGKSPRTPLLRGARTKQGGAFGSPQGKSALTWKLGGPVVGKGAAKPCRGALRTLYKTPIQGLRGVGMRSGKKAKLQSLKKGQRGPALKWTRRGGVAITPWRRGGAPSPLPMSDEKGSLLTLLRQLRGQRSYTSTYATSKNGLSLKRTGAVGLKGNLKWTLSGGKRRLEAAEKAVNAVQNKRGVTELSDVPDATFSAKRRKAAASARATARSKRASLEASLRRRPGAGTPNRERVITVGLATYKMDPSGRTLVRVSEPVTPGAFALPATTPKRASVNGHTYVRQGTSDRLVIDPRGVRKSLATGRLKWSLQNARRRKAAREDRLCPYFSKYGKCNREGDTCPYVHDKDKVAICTKFVLGRCENPACTLTHKIIPERMPVCSYFLEGTCTNERCPFRHVTVAPNAPVCRDFLQGFCPRGENCPQKHVSVCPKFAADGQCEEGDRCGFYHPTKRTWTLARALREAGRKRKRARPAKPQTPPDLGEGGILLPPDDPSDSEASERPRVRRRYFEHDVSEVARKIKPAFLFDDV